MRYTPLPRSPCPTAQLHSRLFASFFFLYASLFTPRLQPPSASPPTSPCAARIIIIIYRFTLWDIILIIIVIVIAYASSLFHHSSSPLSIRITMIAIIDDR
jgi:hypothetical protein